MELKFKLEHTYIPIEETRRKASAGETFVALDEIYKRRVFIKVTYIAGNTPKEQEVALKFAKNEVRAMTEIEADTCFTPRVYETFYDKINHAFYIVMQYIEGKSLREWMVAKMVSPSMMLKWMSSLCDILTALEKHNMQSKDIKPENILITQDKLLYLIDFGISITNPYRKIGTGEYRAPETGMEQQKRVFREMGRGKVDIFAVGVMLYEFYCGESPQYGHEYSRRAFGKESEWKTFIPPIEKNPEMPSAVNDIIVRCMKLRPEDRYQSAAALKDALESAKKQAFRRRRGQ